MKLALERRLGKLEGPRGGPVVVWFGCEPGDKPVSVAVNEAQGITVHFGFELGEIKPFLGCRERKYRQGAGW
jgi:hypothetical protein